MGAEVADERGEWEAAISGAQGVPRSAARGGAAGGCTAGQAHGVRRDVSPVAGGAAMTDIRTAADAEAIRDLIETFAADGWAVDPDTGRVDWEDWADRFERYHPDIDLGSDMLAAGFRAVQRIARAAIREELA